MSNVSEDTELAVIGMVINEPRRFEDCLVVGLTSSHFLLKEARDIWEWIVEREAAGRDFDYAAIALAIVCPSVAQLEVQQL